MVWNNQTRPRTADGVRVYAIGDVHGRADLLERLLARIDEDETAMPTTERAVRVFIGDYIDRGPASRKVLDQLLIQAQKHDVVCLKGNHETFFGKFMNDPSILDQWRLLGGLQTLVSYGLRPSSNPNDVERAKLAHRFRDVVPSSHLELIGRLPLSFTCGDFYFVHAGVRPRLALEKQQEQDLLWIREEFLLSEEMFPKFIVHGHTPVLEPDVRHNRINIDTGAYATGRLTCLKILGDKMSFL